MTSMPPDDQGPEDIDARYRRWSAADSARPHGAVAAAVLGNAAQLAAERTSGNRSHGRPRTVYGWRAPLLGGLAAAALAGFFIIPRFTEPDRPPVKSVAPPAQSPAPATPLSAAQIPKSTAQTVAKRENSVATDLDEVVVTSANRTQHRQPSEGFTAGRQSTDALKSRSADRGEALRQSADSGDLPGLGAVLDEKVSIDSRDSAGRTALLLAVLSGRDAVVGALLARGADPNISDAYGETPLHAAIAGKRTEIAQALRRAGAH